METINIEKYLTELKKPDLVVDNYQQNLRRALLNTSTTTKSKFSFRNVWYKSGLFSAAFITLLIFLLLLVDLSPALTVNDIITKAQAQAETSSIGKEYREIHSKFKYTYNGITANYNFVSQYFFPEAEISPTPIPENTIPDYSLPYTSGVVTFIKFDLGYYQVNNRYFQCEESNNYNIGVGENDNPDGSEQVEYLIQNGCLEVSKDEFNQNLYAYYSAANQPRPEDYSNTIEQEIAAQENSCGSNDGGRIMVNCWGEYYIQLFPLSVQLKEGYEDLSYSDRKEYLESLGFRETSAQHAYALFEYRAHIDNLVYQLAYGLSYTFDAFSIFEEVKNSNHATVIDSTNLQDNLIGVSYSTLYKDKEYISEVYFDKNTYEFKRYRETDNAGNETMLLDVTAIIYY